MSEILPELIAGGKFALYRTGNDGLHIALQVDGSDEVKHMDISPFLVKMALKNPMFAGMRGSND